MKTCVIIGGGIIGMLTGRSLLKRGYKVTLLEKGPFGQEASWAGGGILSPLYPWRYPDAVNRLVFASQRLYPALINELMAVSGIDPERIRSGMLMLGVDDLESAKRWAGQKGVNFTIPDAAAIQKLEPVLVRANAHNLYFPDIAQVRNPRFLKALQEYLRHNGATMLTENEVTQIEASQNQVVAVKTKEGCRLQADIVVIANGAWSGHLLKQMQINLQIQPVRGQMLLLRARPELINRIILQENRYIIPRSDGQVVVGSTVEYVGFDKSTTDQAYSDLRRFAIELIPELTKATVVRHWAGLRPGCGNGIPFIGPHPEIGGLYINAGHFRNGIVMAPASAELIAGLINGEDNVIDASAYSLFRPQLQPA
ncbi:MAG: glycine oxidase ThiO [Gammaproteobacteria bacterium]|nr:glycine oxidase ThiO [Gammaproteobacteria bacterium]